MTTEPAGTGSGPDAQWLPRGVLRLDGVEFATLATPAAERAGRTYLLKRPELVDRHLELYRSVRGGNIVELGVFEGASAMLLLLGAMPRRLATFEIDEPEPALEAFVTDRGLDESVSCHWEVDQGDRPTLARLLDDDFGDEPLDLVVDDASHDLELTRTSFDALFPRLRPGGLFVIEDWRWLDRYAGAIGRESRLRTASDRLRDALEDPRTRARFARMVLERSGDQLSPADRAAIDDAIAAGDGSAVGGATAVGPRDDAPPTAGSSEPIWRGAAAGRPPPLSQLALELVLAKADSDELVSRLTIDPYWVVVERGPADLDPATFRLRRSFVDHYGLLRR